MTKSEALNLLKQGVGIDLGDDCFWTETSALLGMRICTHGRLKYKTFSTRAFMTFEQFLERYPEEGYTIHDV